MLTDANQKIYKANRALFVTHIAPLSVPSDTVPCSTSICISVFFHWSKIEKVSRGIRGEKSSKDMASSSYLVSTIGAQVPKRGTNHVEGDSILLNAIPASIIKLPKWRFQAFHEVSLLEKLTESCLAFRIKHSYEEQARAYRISWEINTP